MTQKLPHIKKPCKECPFRTTSLKGWLGERGIKNILKQGSFVCHKRTDMQCAGHMLLRGQDNDFVQLADRLDIPLDLSGRELVFADEDACIEHHKG